LRRCPLLGKNGLVKEQIRVHVSLPMVAYRPGVRKARSGDYVHALAHCRSQKLWKDMANTTDDKNPQRPRFPLKPDARTRGGSPAEIPPRVQRRAAHRTGTGRGQMQRPGPPRGAANYRRHGTVESQQPAGRQHRERTSRGIDERLVELQALFDVSKTLNSSLNLLNILDTVVRTPMGRMMLTKGMVLIRREEGAAAFVIETAKGMQRELVGQKLAIEFDGGGPFLLDEMTEEQPWVAFVKKQGLKLGAPIISNNKNVGMLFFSGKLSNESFSSSELEYVQSLANLAATAIENGIIFQELKDVNRRLDKKIQELNTVFEIGKELVSTLDPEKIVNLLGFSLMGEVMVQRCLVLLEDNGKLLVRMSKGFKPAADFSAIDEPEVQSVLLGLKTQTLVQDIADEKLRDWLQAQQLIVVSPMHTQEKMRGLVCIGKKITGADFAPEELDFVATLGNTALISLENARLFGEALEKQRLEEELAIARQIQQRLLPKEPPKLSDFEIAAVNLPTYSVGGDYFDYFAIDDHRYIISIADVSGKGIPAALLMSNMQATLHAMIFTEIPLNQIVARINTLLYQNTTYDKFITGFVGILDLRDRTFTSVNAGHNFPYLCHANGEMETLQKGGLLLGMIPNVAYEIETHHLQSGDWVFMFTDGINEAMNVKDEEFTDARLEEVLRTNLGSSAADMVRAMSDAVKLHTAGAPQSDDITMIAIKVY
jgi:sigma-B regulation protein RsbU (phosphoserine phosphatase)